MNFKAIFKTGLIATVIGGTATAGFFAFAGENTDNADASVNVVEQLDITVNDINFGSIALTSDDNLILDPDGTVTSNAGDHYEDASPGSLEISGGNDDESIEVIWDEANNGVDLDGPDNDPITLNEISIENATNDLNNSNNSVTISDGDWSVTETRALGGTLDFPNANLDHGEYSGQFNLTVNYQ